jgi:dihydroorotate dehydrogenase (fumarate)
MANLTTTHLGISIKNPLILGASNLVNNIDNLKKAEDAGIAAVIYRSLFEEQIQLEDYDMSSQLEAYNERHAEMINLFPNLEHAGPKEHLFNLRKAKESLSIPVFASINAVYKESWADYARQIEETGVDGIELNFFSVPREFDKTADDILKEQVEFLTEVKANVKVPVSVKMSSFYTNILHAAREFDRAGAEGFILFNRLFEPDIDVEAEKHAAPWNLSTPSDHRLSIRYLGLLYDQVKGTLTANNGIYEGSDVIKMILAGADSVQAVSTFYHNGIKHVATMLEEMEQWMERKGYKALSDFKGSLSSKAINDPFVYKRAQYIDMILKSEEYFNPIT